MPENNSLSENREAEQTKAGSTDVVIVRTGRERYRTEVDARGHFFVADEPESAGGTDQGPNPTGLLLSALGACKTITVRMYADRKEWPVETIEARLTHKKVDAADCEDCKTEKGKVDVIEVEMAFTGDLDEKQLDRLLDISTRCPVHRTLTSETVIRSARK